MKRNIPEEILKYKASAKSSHNFLCVWYMIELEHILHKLDDSDRGDYELLRCIPIRIIACFQEFFRLSMKEIIDNGKTSLRPDFSKLKEDAKIEWELVFHLSKNSFTIGELIAHLLPYNSLNNINSNIKNIIGIDFIEELKTYDRKSINEAENQNTDYFKQKTGEIIKSVNVIFDLRNKFCHEKADDYKIDINEFNLHFYHCKVFIEHSWRVIANIINPNYPETTLGMIDEANGILAKAETELDEVITKIKRITKEDIFPSNEKEYRDFDLLQEKWKEYRKLYAELSSQKVKGGSLHPIWYCYSMIHLTEERLKSLKKQYDNFL